MAQRQDSPNITVRCPVCETPRTASLPRRQIEHAGSDPLRLQGTGVRCAECGESFACYYF